MPPRRTGSAFIEIVGDFDRFGADAEKKLNKALKELGLKADFKDLVNAAGDAGGEAGEEFGEEFDKQARRRVRRTGRDAGEELVDELGDGAESGRSRSRLGSTFKSLGRLVGTGFSLALANAAGGVTAGLDVFKSLQGGASFATALAPLATNIGSLLISLGVMVATVPFAVSAIVSLAGALFSLSGVLLTLPGILAVLLGAILPVVVAFQGFGEAISAIMSGDPKKIDEALKALSPSARAVAKEFQTLVPLFKQIQQVAQQALFAPLVGSLKELFKAIGPTLVSGFAAVAGSVGRLIAAILRLGQIPAVQGFLTRLFGTPEQAGAIGRIIERLTPAFTTFLEALTGAADHAMPFVEQVFGALGTGLEKISAALNQSMQDGSFQNALQTGLDIARDLYNLAKELLGLFVAIFTETDEGGATLLQDATEALRRLKEFFQSEDGKRALQVMVGLAKDFGSFLKAAAGWITTITNLLGAAGQAVNNFGERLKRLPSMSPLTGIVGRFFAEGGIVTGPTFSVIGEDGPEAVVPLNKPARARAVMAEAGLLPLAANMGGGENVSVQVFLGTREITDILDSRVERGIQSQARQLARGPRAA